VVTISGFREEWPLLQIILFSEIYGFEILNCVTSKLVTNKEIST